MKNGWKRPIADIRIRSYFRKMSEWTPAAKDEVERAIAHEMEESDISNWRHMLVEPFECTIERFGGVEVAFVVAIGPERVVYFDDVEEDFGTAKVVAGRLEGAAAYGPLIVALREAAAGR
ncbi:hypothetical protein [Sphingopyxis fribergensis]